ncbi:MAG: pyridoxamine 5'-phosphate oxidase family protein [Parvibaculum sp.]|uniref:pyridoxamine 5'-phosphate oxidase family protein n=1 Tax=Parvibaculum sp. TaxID=2024848 RepID=UPI0034A0244A
MAKQFPSISPEFKAFIERQHIFFTASATAESRINLSPKGLDGFRVTGENEVCYLDLTGSGNEAAAHLRADGRMTIMFCAFEGPPMILRLYGRGRVARKGTADYAHYLAGFFDGNEPVGARQIVVVDVELVQTSCGFGVPLHDYKEERPSLVRWAEAQGEDGIAAYWQEKNRVSIDGLPTGVA